MRNKLVLLLVLFTSCTYVYGLDIQDKYCKYDENGNYKFISDCLNFEKSYSMESISDHTKLSFINCYGDGIRKLLEEFPNKDSVEMLELYNTNIFKIDEIIIKYKNVHTLYLDIPFCQTDFLKHFNNLRRLSLDSYVFFDYHPNLKNLDSLKLNNVVDMDFSNEISKYQNLQSLGLMNMIIDSFPNSLKNMRTLSILDLYIKNPKLFLSDMENLRYLTVNNAQISDLTLPNNLRWLYLSKINIRNFPIEITENKNIEFILLDNNHISNIPNDIVKLQKLRHFSINNNDIQEFPCQLFKIKKLHIIYLNNNKIMDITKISEYLNDTIKDKCIYLEGNPLNQESIKLIKKLNKEGYDIRYSEN